MDDLSKLESEFSISITPHMATVNNTQRTDRRDARDILSSRQRLEVQRVYAPIFQTFDYPA
jgi:hypothetical protein